mgnify:CR=1 FL=1
MPLYDYECRKCVYYTEIWQGMMDDPIQKCPNCGENALVKVIINPPAAIVRGEAKTIGQLADKNTRKMGKYELEDRQQKDNVAQKQEVSDKRKLHQKINSMSEAQKLKWIRGGD